MCWLFWLLIAGHSWHSLWHFLNPFWRQLSKSLHLPCLGDCCLGETPEILMRYVIFFYFLKGFRTPGMTLPNFPNSDTHNESSWFQKAFPSLYDPRGHLCSFSETSRWWQQRSCYWSQGHGVWERDGNGKANQERPSAVKRQGKRSPAGKHFDEWTSF